MPSPSAPRHFILDHMQVISMAGDRALVWTRDGNAAIELPHWTLALLRQCSGLRTLDDHARTSWGAQRWKGKLALARAMMAQLSRKTASELNPGRGYFPRMVASVLEDLAGRGVFVCDTDLAGDRPARPSTPPPITTVGVASGHRANSLQACLESYGANHRRWGRTPTFVVCDDSRDEETQQAYLAAIGRVAPGLGIRVDYIGRADKARFIAALSRRAEVDPALLSFAMATPDDGSFAAGANRNALLLQTVGERTATFDDDTRCEIYQQDDPTSGLRVAAAGSQPFFLRRFASREDATACLPRAEADLLAHYEAYLGKSVRRCIAEVIETHGSGSVDLSTLQGRPLREILDGGGRVVATLGGLVGDSGSNERYGHLDRGPHLAPLDSLDEASFRVFARSREITKSVAQTVLVRPRGCMTTFLGLDNTCLLPPFFPRFREEDGAFGQMIGQLHAAWYFAYLPFSLLHAPEQRRERAPVSERGDAVVMFTPSQVVRECISSLDWGLTAADETSRMMRMGDALIELASADPHDYRAALVPIALNQQGRTIDWLEGLRASGASMPAFWQRELTEQLAGARAEIHGSVVLADHQLVGKVGVAEAERRCQAMVRDYGALLKAWPRIRDAALALKNEGAPLARTVFAGREPSAAEPRAFAQAERTP